MGKLQAKGKHVTFFAKSGERYVRYKGLQLLPPQNVVFPTWKASRMRRGDGEQTATYPAPQGAFLHRDSFPVLRQASTVLGGALRYHGAELIL